VSLPITSSSVDFEHVRTKRQQKFSALVSEITNTGIAEEIQPQQFINYHYSSDTEGKFSVKMSRDDAHTVSFSHISVQHNTPDTTRLTKKPNILFYYHDLVTDQINKVLSPPVNE
jgi:hypothetical protein